MDFFGHYHFFDHYIQSSNVNVAQFLLHLPAVSSCCHLPAVQFSLSFTCRQSWWFALVFFLFWSRWLFSSAPTRLRGMNFSRPHSTFLLVSPYQVAAPQVGNGATYALRSSGNFLPALPERGGAPPPGTGHLDLTKTENTMFCALIFFCTAHNSVVPAGGAHAKVEFLNACMKRFGKKDAMNEIKNSIKKCLVLPMSMSMSVHEMQCGSLVHFCMVNLGYEKSGHRSKSKKGGFETGPCRQSSIEKTQRPHRQIIHRYDKFTHPNYFWLATRPTEKNRVKK